MENTGWRTLKTGDVDACGIWDFCSLSSGIVDVYSKKKRAELASVRFLMENAVSWASMERDLLAHELGVSCFTQQGCPFLLLLALFFFLFIHTRMRPIMAAYLLTIFFPTAVSVAATLALRPGISLNLHRKGRFSIPELGQARTRGGFICGSHWFCGLGFFVSSPSPVENPVLHTLRHRNPRYIRAQSSLPPAPLATGESDSSIGSIITHGNRCSPARLSWTASLDLDYYSIGLGGDHSSGQDVWTDISAEGRGPG